MNTDKYQICSKCEKDKPTAEFHRRGAGFQKICKACTSIKGKAIYKERGRSRVRSAEMKPFISADIQALDERIAPLVPTLIGIAKRYAVNDVEAEDIYQGMMESIFTKCKPEDTNSYIIEAAKFYARDFRSKANTYDFRVEEADDDSPIFEAPCMSAEDEVIQQETLEAIKKIIETLPAQNQKIISLLSVGYKQREIAESFGVTEQNISELLKKMRKGLAGAGLSSNGLTFSPVMVTV